MQDDSQNLPPNQETQTLSAICTPTTSILGKNVTLQYDTGSDVTIIGKNEWTRIGSPKLVASDIIEHADGSELEIIGRFHCTIRALGREGKIDIDVASRNSVNLFGLSDRQP